MLINNVALLMHRQHLNTPNRTTATTTKRMLFNAIGPAGLTSFEIENHFNSLATCIKDNKYAGSHTSNNNNNSNMPFNTIRVFIIYIATTTTIARH